MDEAMLAKAGELYAHLPKGWRKRIGASLGQGEEVLGQAIRPAAQLWELLAR